MTDDEPDTTVDPDARVAPDAARNALRMPESVVSRTLSAAAGDADEAADAASSNADEGVPLHRRRDLRPGGSDASSPRPVVAADGRIELGEPLVGRGDGSQWWYLPAYSVSTPADRPLLSCRLADVPNATAEDVWEGRLTLDYATDRSVDDDRWQAVVDDRPGASIDRVPATLDRVELRVPYLDEDDELVTEAIQGTVEPASNRVAFDLTGDLLKVAYATLANPAEGANVRPAVVFYAAFEGWDDLGGLDGPELVRRAGRLATAAADGRADAVEMGLLGGSSFVAARAAGVTDRWTDLDLGRGFDVAPIVLASVQTFGSDAPVGVRLRNRSPTTVDARLEPDAAPDDRDSSRTWERVPARRGGDSQRRRHRTRARRGTDSQRRRHRSKVRRRDHRNRTDRSKVRRRDHRDRTDRSKVRRRDHRDRTDRSKVRRRDHRNRDENPPPKRRDHRRRAGTAARVGAETLGYVGLARGPVHDAAGERVGEVDVERVRQPDGSHWHTRSLEGEYDDPVVFAQLLTYEGRHQCHTRVRSVSGGPAGSFEVQLEEWDALDDRHTEEAVGYVVLEAGRHELVDGRTVDVGTVRTTHEWAHCSVDAFDSVPVVVSHSQTYNGHQAVVTRHRNVDPTGFDVRLQEERANDDRHATETVGYAAFDTAPPTYDPTLFVVEQPVTAGIPCEDHPHAYVVERDGDAITFGCAPPWSGADVVGQRWKQIHPGWAPSSVALFESRVEPDTFLVVPDAFVIARNDESHAPAMLLLQAPDPVGDESLVQFEFTVAPALTPYERRFVEQRLYDHTRRVDGEPRRPTVLLPGDVHGLPQSFAWADEASATVNYSPFADGYTFTVSYEQLSRAALAVETLTAEQGQLTGTIRYELAEDATASSTVALDLNRTTGSALDASLVGDTVVLANECDDPVTVAKLLFFTDGEPGAETVELGEPLTVAPGETETVAVVVPGDDAGAEAGVSVAPHFSILEDPSATLAERKIDVARLTVHLSVTTNLDPMARAIDRIALSVRLPAADEQESCDLVPGENGFADSSQVLRFRLPLDSYLRPADRVVAYQATVSFGDDRADHVTPWTDHRLSESALLHLTAEALGLPDTPD